MFQQEDQGSSGGTNKPVKSQGSGGGQCPATRSTLERVCPARQARRAARRLREQQEQGPKVPSNLEILELHTREVLRRLEVGPLEEVRGTCQTPTTQNLNVTRSLAYVTFKCFVIIGNNH